jgi:hypothetical protein
MNGTTLFEDRTLEDRSTQPWEIDQPEDVKPPIDVFARAVVLQLQFRRLGTARKVSTDTVEVRGESESRKTDKDLLGITARILDSPELEAIRKHDGQTERFIDSKKSGPAFANQGGFYLLAIVLQGEIEAWLDTREAERWILIERLLDVFDARVEDTKRRLGPLAATITFPTRDQARAAFGLTRRYMSFGFERDPQAAAEWRSEALGECRQALRAAFADVVAHLADRLEPGPEGKPKTFRDSLIANFNEFVESFNARNLADDGELAELVAKARGVLSGVDATDLRKRDGLRAAVARSMAAIKPAVDALVMDKPTRLYGDD